jgi:nucleoside-diphosphate-sugar epimerase
LRALVTGATGFVGSHLVRSLLRRGDSVRILAREVLKAAPLQAHGAQVHRGDLGVPASLRGIAEDVDVVFHLGSMMRGSASDFERVDVRGTERLLEEARRARVGRFVYAGTLAGYPPASMGAVIDERTPLDDTGRLGNYALAKARCEKLVLSAGTRGETEAVVVRLGLVCGAGANLFPPHVCKVIARNWVILFGDGRVPLPLTLIDNAVDALVRGATMPGVAGKAFNIVDDDILTQLDYLELLRKCRGGAPHVLRLPLSAYYAIGLLSEIGAAARGKEPETTRYRIRCRNAHVRWDCSKAKRVLQWRPRLPLREGLMQAFRMSAARLGARTVEPRSGRQ